MRKLITLWLVLALTLKGLLGSGTSTKLPKPEKKRNSPIPPLREDWYTDPAMGREMKREF
jgi:hypothetical protein